MSCDCKNAVKEFKSTFSLKEIHSDALADTLDAMGYTVIDFHPIQNDEDVAQLIYGLHLEEMTACHRGFTYCDNNYRIVFVSNVLTEDERLTVLAHECGHIFLGHMSEQAIVGRDVMQEHDANEFAHYLLHPHNGSKLCKWASTNKRVILSIVVCAALLLLAATAITHISRQRTYYGKYYVTTGGEKYHTSECVIIKNHSNTRRFTKDDYESGNYTPCQKCIPQS